MHISVEESQNCFLPYNPCQCVYLYSTSNMALLQKFIKEMRRPFDRNFGCYPYTCETDMGLDIFCSSHYLYFWLDIYLRVIAHDLSSL